MAYVAADGSWRSARKLSKVSSVQAGDAIEPLPDLGILQKVLCDHGSTRHAELS